LLQEKVGRAFEKETRVSTYAQSKRTLTNLGRPDEGGEIARKTMAAFGFDLR
jgi:hypothetical protein